MADETLLIVDDDPFMRELLVESLSQEGYQVTAAEDGKQAQHALNLNEFQVALLDLSLPDMDGMELIEAVSNGSPEAQIIIMTGYPSLESAIEALRESAQDYIVKPFKLPEVHAAVNRALKNQKLQVEVRDLRRRVRDLEQEVHRLRTGAGAGAAVGQNRPRPQASRPTALPGAYGALAPPRPPEPESQDGEPPA